MERLKEYLKIAWLKTLICFLYGILIMCIYNISNGWDKVITYGNGAFIAGFTLVGYGGLSLVNKAGGFDIYSYMFNKKRMPDGSKETLYDYSLRKKSLRSKKSYVTSPYIIIGLLYILVSVICSFVK